MKGVTEIHLASVEFQGQADDSFYKNDLLSQLFAVTEQHHSLRGREKLDSQNTNHPNLQ